MRLAGRTTFITPDGGGRGAGDVTTQDLAHAIGCVTDPLAQEMVMAVACQSMLGWRRVEALAHPILVDEMLHARASLSCSQGVQRYRVRMIVRQVFVDVVLARRTRCGRLARRLRMRNKDCRAMYRRTAALLEEKTQEGARTACEKLLSN